MLNPVGRDLLLILHLPEPPYPATTFLLAVNGALGSLFFFLRVHTMLHRCLKTPRVHQLHHIMGNHRCRKVLTLISSDNHLNV